MEQATTNKTKHLKDYIQTNPEISFLSDVPLNKQIEKPKFESFIISDVGEEQNKIIWDNWRISPKGALVYFEVSPAQDSYPHNQPEETLLKEVKLLRESLNDRYSGIGLMRISFLMSFVFVLFFTIGLYTHIVLVHPILSILGFITSVGFFLIGSLNINS